MKPSTTAVIGTLVLTGSWASLPTVAFADVSGARAENASRLSAQIAMDKATGQRAGSCHAAGAAHAASCTCARCSAASAD